MRIRERRSPETEAGAPSAAPAMVDRPAPVERESPLERGEERNRPLVRPAADVPQKSPWRGVATGMRILGAVGFVGLAALGGIAANYYGFSTRETVLVSGLLGLFGASLGAVIPPLTKAIGWILLAAGIAAIGIGSLRLLGLLVPEFLERVLG
jgi:hypothetical protein